MYDANYVAAQRNAEQLYKISEMRRMGAVEAADRLYASLYGAAKQKPAPYVRMKDRPDVVQLGRRYDEMLTANVELNRCLKRIGVIDAQKQPSAERLEERKQLWAEAEEWQSIADQFFCKYPDYFIGHVACVAARRAFLQKMKEG